MIASVTDAEAEILLSLAMLTVKATRATQLLEQAELDGHVAEVMDLDQVEHRLADGDQENRVENHMKPVPMQQRAEHKGRHCRQDTRIGRHAAGRGSQEGDGFRRPGQ